MQIIYHDKFTVIDDYCHNPSSYEAVFNAIQNLQYDNLHIVNGIRGNRGADINKKNAEVLKQWYDILNVKKLVITDSGDCIDLMNRALENEKNIYFEVFHHSSISFQYERNLRDAIAEGIRDLKQGDILLLLGAQSMDKGKELFFGLINHPKGIPANDQMLFYSEDIDYSQKKFH